MVDRGARSAARKKVYRVGLLTNGVVIGATDERRKNLVSVLAAQGFVEGQNLTFEQRSADAQPRCRPRDPGGTDLGRYGGRRHL